MRGDERRCDVEPRSTYHAVAVVLVAADGERLRRGMVGDAERLAFLKRSLEGEGVVKVKAA